MFADAGFRNHTFRWNVISDAYSEPSQTSKMAFISINILHKVRTEKSSEKISSD